MKFKIQWFAYVGEEKDLVTNFEELEADDSTKALALMRTPLVSRLASYGKPYAVHKLSFINVGSPIEVNMREQLSFLNSINSDGGLETTAKMPTKFEIQFNADGSVKMTPSADN